MRRLSFGLAFLLAACGSSSDEGATDSAGQGPGGSGGVGAAQDSGAGGAGGKGLGGSSGGAGRVGTGGGGGSAGAGGSSGVGGSIGTGGGSGGADAGAPHVVGACDGLGAVGAWQEITPADLSPSSADAGGGSFYDPSAFVLDPINAGTVYMGTNSYNDGHSKGLFKSTDCGATWAHVSTGTNSDAIDGGREWSMQIDFIDSRILYTQSGYYKMGLFKSTNGGVDWTDITDPAGAGFVGDIQMDPTDPKHVMNTWHTNCGNYSDGIGCFAETKDGGVTWKEHYGTPSWPGQVRVLLLHGSTWAVLSDTVLLTTDGGATYKSVLGTAAGGHSSGTLSRMKNGDYFIGTQYGMIRSPAASDGSQWDVLANSGQWVGDVTESATTMFATQGQNHLMTSPVGDGVTWTFMQAGPSGCGRTHYDLDHRLLYVECGGNGFWRVVMQ